jgi:putative ABC transport system ATP-binding protein
VSIVIGGVFRPALADYWYEHYERAQQALAKQDWSGAIRELNLAIEKRSDPGARVKTYGLNFVDYHPYLDLAIAYGKLGQFDAALQALDVEERAGAIALSKSGADKLRETRTAVNDAKTRASQTSERERRETAVARSLEEVTTMEASGDVDGAIAAAGRGLAVDPQNVTLLSALTRLQARAAEAARKRDAAAQYAQWVSGGKAALENGRYEEASALFQQALATKRSPDLQSLLEQSQEKLAERIRGTQDASARDATVREALDAAENFGEAARFPEAVAKLQTVLALDPKNQRALALQARLIDLQTKADAARLRSDDVKRLLGEGETLLGNGRGQSAAQKFNSVLALDPTNGAARASLVKAIVLMSDAILSGTGGPGETTPPLISLANTSFLERADRRGWREESIEPRFLPATVLQTLSAKFAGASVDKAQRPVLPQTAVMADGSGSYVLDGAEVADLTGNDLSLVRARKLGFVFQQYMLLPRQNALRQVEMPLIYRGVSAGERRRRAEVALRIVGMSQRMDHKPNELSGGQQQRVAIARALVNNPRIIMADEPTGALDTRTGEEIMGIFQQLNREQGITVILVTHDHEVAQHARRVISVRDGAVASDEGVPEPLEVSIQMPERVAA